MERFTSAGDVPTDEEAELIGEIQKLIFEKAHNASESQEPEKQVNKSVICNGLKM